MINKKTKKNTISILPQFKSDLTLVSDLTPWWRSFISNLSKFLLLNNNYKKVIIIGSTAIILFTYFSNLSLLNQLNPPNTIEIYSKIIKKNNTLKNSTINIKINIKKVQYGIFGSKNDPILRIQHPSTLLSTKNKTELSVLNQLKIQFPESFDPKNIMKHNI
uniref:Uncharacterized protein n=1 Tax=viral metagenome TaxID=1070528 RepID=A0A6C0HN58_9ZZZZ